MQVNAIAGYDSALGTATLFLDANPNSGAGYDETGLTTLLWQEIFSQTAGNRSGLLTTLRRLTTWDMD